MTRPSPSPHWAKPAAVRRALISALLTALVALALVGGARPALAHANLVRSDEDRTTADARRRLEAAEHVVEVLGAMKGPAMKVGQMASMLDLGGLPPDELEGLQAKLGELRDSRR